MFFHCVIGRDSQLYLHDLLNYNVNLVKLEHYLRLPQLPKINT